MSIRDANHHGLRRAVSSLNVGAASLGKEAQQIKAVWNALVKTICDRSKDRYINKMYWPELRMRCDHFWMIIIVNKRRSYQLHQGCFEEGVQLMSAELANDTYAFGFGQGVSLSSSGCLRSQESQRGERK